ARVNCNRPARGQTAVAGPTCSGRQDLSGRACGRSGKLRDRRTEDVRDPDVAGPVDGNALRMPDAGLAVAVAGGDDGAVAGELADAVAHVVGDPDVAALIDGDTAGPVAAGIAGELAAVGRDLDDSASVGVPHPCV